MQLEPKTANFVDLAQEKCDILLPSSHLKLKRGTNMPKVNLDGLIRRENLEVTGEAQPTGSPIPGIAVTELKQETLTFQSLRKPDFQRETSEWDPEKVCGLVESFVNGDTIPAVILWRSPSGYLFVIDGSHRLSALAAWVNRDYGAGSISRQVFESILPSQTRFAGKTADLIKERVREYGDYQSAGNDNTPRGIEFAKKARKAMTNAIPVQWLQADSAENAEKAFLKINKEAVPINDTELRLIEGRNKPNAIAARAIINAGMGHQYWPRFREPQKTEILGLADKINRMLFTPPLEEGGAVKTLDLPIAGKFYSSQTLPLVFDLVNIVNGISLEKKKSKKKQNESTPKRIEDDKTGDLTIEYLKKCRSVVQIINSADNGSLGLHPGVYFYSLQGRHKIASFHAVTAWIMGFTKQDQQYFTAQRKGFESFLLEYPDLVQHFVRKYRGSSLGYLEIKNFFQRVLELLGEGNSGLALVRKLKKEKKYVDLPISRMPETKTSGDFSQAKKSEAFMRTALKDALRCSICGGYLHRNSFNTDHIQPKREGGDANIDNAQITHYYCNSSKG